MKRKKHYNLGKKYCVVVALCCIAQTSMFDPKYNPIFVLQIFFPKGKKTCIIKYEVSQYLIINYSY